MSYEWFTRDELYVSGADDARDLQEAILAHPGEFALDSLHPIPLGALERLKELRALAAAGDIYAQRNVGYMEGFLQVGLAYSKLRQAYF